MQQYTVDQLITETVAVDNTPLSQQTFSTAVIASYLDEEMRNTVVPLFTAAREEYFVHTWSFPVDSESKGFAIPSQTAGFRLRDIYLYTPEGQFSSKLIRINPDQIPYMGISNGYYQPAYYVENNNIVFYPKLGMSGVLKVRYFKAPNHLSTYALAGGQVTAKLPGNVLQLDNVPTTWMTFTGPNAITIDVTNPDSPYNFVEYDTTSASPGAPVINSPISSADSALARITVSNDAYASVDIGDYVWENDKCGFVQFLPFEAYYLIKLRASMRILKAQGDLQNLSVSAQLYNAAADDLKALISPKIENQVKRVAMSANMLRGTRRGFYGRTF